MERSRRIAVVFLSLALVVPLALVALIGLVVVPSWADVETFCLLSETSSAVDAYSTAFIVVILVTAVATVGLMVGYVGRIRWHTLLPPVAWVTAILLAEYLAALTISPQDCVGGIGF